MICSDTLGTAAFRYFCVLSCYLNVRKATSQRRFEPRSWNKSYEMHYWWSYTVRSFVGLEWLLSTCYSVFVTLKCRKGKQTCLVLVELSNFQCARARARVCCTHFAPPHFWNRIAVCQWKCSSEAMVSETVGKDIWPSAFQAGPWFNISNMLYIKYSMRVLGIGC